MSRRNHETLRSGSILPEQRLSVFNEGDVFPYHIYRRLLTTAPEYHVLRTMVIEAATLSASTVVPKLEDAGLMMLSRDVINGNCIRSGVFEKRTPSKLHDNFRKFIYLRCADAVTATVTDVSLVGGPNPMLAVGLESSKLSQEQQGFRTVLREFGANNLTNSEIGLHWQVARFKGVEGAGRAVEVARALLQPGTELQFDKPVFLTTPDPLRIPQS